MSPTAKFRLTLFIVISLIVGVIVFFEPNLNIGAQPPNSIYAALKAGQPPLPLLTKWLATVLAIFGGLFFLIGLGPSDKKNTTEQKSKPSKSEGTAKKE